MRPAIIHYSKNIYNGKFDENGVPMIGLSSGKFEYFPINIAQYGFMIHAAYLANPNDKLLNTLKSCLKVLENIKAENETQAIWWHNHFEEKYKISPPWSSAMAQGEIISFYLRMYQLLNEKKLLQTAEKAYCFMQLENETKSIRRYDEFGNLWFEEYPSSPPSYVLNGFVYALFGLIDLYRVTNNQSVKFDIDRCISTLKNRLKDFDSGYWSYYDLQKKELVRYYYQKNVHILQLEILYLLTNEPVFRKYKLKWEKQLTLNNFILVRIMYRILPRYRKALKFTKGILGL
jgi:hypothetical protein